MHHVIPRVMALIAMSAILSACANGYGKFYTASSDAATTVALRVAPPPQQPIVERIGSIGLANTDAVVKSYVKRGYVLIGSSSFNSGRNESDEAAVEQAKKVGADLVLIADPQYTGSTTSAMPLTMPTTTTSYSSGTATAYGPGGSVNAYGSGMTTTYGSTTTMIPITVHRRQYKAAYFVKRAFSFGATYRALNAEERRNLQTNRGVAIDVVVDRSPAYEADILPGDLVVAVNNELVRDEQSMSELIKTNAGQLAKFTIYREGKTVEKQIQLLR